MEINTSTWILIFNSAQLKNIDGTAVIFDPKAGDKPLTVSVKQIFERFSGKIN